MHVGGQVASARIGTRWPVGDKSARRFGCDREARRKPRQPSALVSCSEMQTASFQPEEKRIWETKFRKSSIKKSFCF